MKIINHILLYQFIEINLEAGNKKTGICLLSRLEKTAAQTRGGGGESESKFGGPIKIGFHLRPHWNPLDNHNTIVSRGSRGDLWLGPDYAERRWLWRKYWSWMIGSRTLPPPGTSPFVAHFVRVRIGDSSRNRFASTAYFTQSQFPCILFMGGVSEGELPVRWSNRRGIVHRGKCPGR